MSTDNGHDPDAPLDDALPEAEIDDPEEYVDRRRLRDIFNAREELRQVRVQSAYHRTPDARSAYRAAVSTYVSEVEPLFLSDDRGIYYWNEIDLGTTEIRPEYEPTADGYTVEPHGQRATMDTPPTTEQIELVGVRSIFELPTPLQGTVRYVESGGYGTDTVDTLTFSRRMPFPAADAYARATNRFLASIGLEVDVDTDTDEWEIGTR